jgi:myo-inositol 2-dehydrogenase/D-chiro-inositol 1-dehydrogenase
MQNDKIKAGVVGFGRMGQKYCEEMQNNPLYELAYICDKDPVARRAASEKFVRVTITENEDQLFQDKTLNAVGLFTLADARPAQIAKAIENNKHILCEKPIADNIATEWAMVQQIEKSDRIAAVNLFNRNAWYHQEIIDFIRSGEIGDPAIIRIAHMTPGHMPQEGHEPEGPAFHDCGMHYVDVARWYAGSEYDRFHAQGLRMWSYKDPWWIQVHGTFQNGIVFDITQGFVYGHLAKDLTHNCYVDVIGTQGIARMNHDFRTATIELHGVSKTLRKSDEFGDKKIGVLTDLFARSVIEGKNLGLPTVRDSVIASDIAWKMLDDAVQNGCPPIGKPEEMEQIIARRAVLKEGYGLPSARYNKNDGEG